MKTKIYLFSFLLFSLWAHAQDSINRPKYENFGITFKFSTIPGLSIDYETNDVLFPLDNHYNTYVWRGGITGATVTDGFIDYIGSGTFAEILSRKYIGKHKKDYKGFYSENTLLHYTRIRFEERNYTGTYAYFSFFAPGFGYKLKIGKINLEASANYQWLIQIRGRGDVDNRGFDNWIFNTNIRASYTF